mmetsp:Transcript_25677/g.44972  ORF Transcript_25677/g.44972 Transcript_25677/m.44972 type:complete len:233 (-) Transcript_25677:214-912(-)
MGCASTRELGEEEECLVDDEEALGLSRQQADKIDAVFRKFSTHFRLNDNQFRDAAEMLKIPLGDATGIGSLNAFYEQFKELGCYKLHRLLILAVLLGKGSKRNKVQLWFEIYDNKGTHSLNRIDVRKMVNKTFTVAADYLLKLNTQRVERTLILNYYDRLQSVKVRTCDEIIKRLFKEDVELSRDLFIVRFEHEADFADLISSSGFRRFAYDLYKKSPPAAFIAVNPRPSQP